jgi:hypothetical protein
MDELRSTNQQRQARKWKIKLSKVGSRIIPRSVLPQCATCQALHGKEIIHQEYFFDWRLFTFFDTLVCAPMKYWEIIADKLKKVAGAWVTSQPLISRSERCSLQTLIAMTGSVLLCTPMKSWLPSWNWKGRFVSAY